MGHIRRHVAELLRNALGFFLSWQIYQDGGKVLNQNKQQERTRLNICISRLNRHARESQACDRQNCIVRKKIEIICSFNGIAITCRLEMEFCFRTNQK